MAAVLCEGNYNTMNKRNKVFIQMSMTTKK